jgi:hypothetical protein
MSKIPPQAAGLLYDRAPAPRRARPGLIGRAGMTVRSALAPLTHRPERSRVARSEQTAVTPLPPLPGPGLLP